MHEYAKSVMYFMPKDMILNQMKHFLYTHIPLEINRAMNVNNFKMYVYEFIYSRSIQICKNSEIYKALFCMEVVIGVLRQFYDYWYDEG